MRIELGRGLFSPPDAQLEQLSVWGLGLGFRVSRPGKLISEINITYLKPRNATRNPKL